MVDLEEGGLREDEVMEDGGVVLKKIEVREDEGAIKEEDRWGGLKVEVLV